MLPGLGTVALALAAWEGAWWLSRLNERHDAYARAGARAAALGRPLVVVGAPDRGSTRGPGCGDISVDVQTSSCPVHLQADITKPLPFPDDSVVVFVSCVLEYVEDLDAAMRELTRISGGEMFIVAVKPWTLTAYLYPGTKRQMW